MIPAIQEESVDLQQPSELSIHKPRKHWWWLILLLLLFAAAYALTTSHKSTANDLSKRANSQEIPVATVIAKKGQIPVFLNGLGTVTPYNTVTVKTRVDGQLVRIGFQEGQLVHEGPLLAEIDPRPFEVQLEQAQGQQARDVAQLNNAKIDLARYQTLIKEDSITQQQALVRQNRADYFPTITTNPTITTSHASENRSLTLDTSGATSVKGTSTNYLLPVDLTYEVDLWGRIRNEVSSSKANAQASAADLENIRLSLQAELASDYFLLRALDAQKQLSDSTVQTFEKALQLTRNRHDAGIASGADVALAETQLETTRAEAIDVGVQRAQTEHAIAVLIGQSASEFSISSDPLQGLPPAIPSGLPSELLERRPDIAASERRVAAANAQIGVAQAAFFPSLILNATGGFQSSSIANWLSWPSRIWSLGPALFQTIFDAGRRHAISDQAWASYDQSVANYRENVLTAFQDVEDNLAQLRILEDEAKVQDDAVQSAERSLQISNNQYQSGIATYIQVLTAQSALLASQRTAVEILQRRMSASVLLIKALGGSWA